jgi:tRNA(Ile)-lysidine synthase
MPARKRIDWLRCAAALAAAVPRARLHPAVLAWAERSAPRRAWAVAFSGGADSLALLLLVWAHWPRRRARLVALHFNHRLRGRESGADERFCARVCAVLGVRFVRGNWRRARDGAGEAEARDARLDFFRRHARVVWLGHQQDDVAETMLMRLARGSGAAGLAAPRPVQTLPGGRVHLRPLLGLKKVEICAALREAGIAWREDGSNATAKFFRNRVRHQVVAAWSAAAERDALAGAALSRELLEEDDEALEAWVTQIVPQAADGALNLRRLAGKPRAVWRRALHRWLLRQPGAGRNLSRQAIAALLDDAMRARPTRHSLGTAGFAVIARTRLRFSAAPRKK